MQNRNDIKKLGYSGVEIGWILNGLLELVIDEKCENDKKVLIEKARDMSIKDGDIE